MPYTPLSEIKNNAVINNNENQWNIILKSGRTLHAKKINETTNNNYCAVLEEIMHKTCGINGKLFIML